MTPFHLRQGHLHLRRSHSPPTYLDLSLIRMGLWATNSIWVREFGNTDYCAFRLKWWSGCDHLDVDATAGRLNWRFYLSGNVTVTATLSDNLKHVLDAGEQVSDLGSVQVVATATDGHFTSDTVTSRSRTTFRRRRR